MRIRRLPRAVRDVDEIWQWIATDNVAAANRWAERIAEATNRLGCPFAISCSAFRCLLLLLWTEVHASHD